MGLVWAEERNNTHTLPITRQLWAVQLQPGSFISVLSVVLVLQCINGRVKNGYAEARAKRHKKKIVNTKTVKMLSNYNTYIINIYIFRKLYIAAYIQKTVWKSLLISCKISIFDHLEMKNLNYSIKYSVTEQSESHFQIPIWI